MRYLSPTVESCISVWNMLMKCFFFLSSTDSREFLHLLYHMAEAQTVNADGRGRLSSCVRVLPETGSREIVILSFDSAN